MTPPSHTHTYQTHGKKLVHLSRVKVVQDLDLVQNPGSSWDERRTAQISVGVLRLEEEPGELPPLHGEQTQLKPPQCQLCITQQTGF